MFVLVLKYDWLVALTDLVGAALPTTALFVGGIVFLILISVQFSIKLSTFSDQLKNLAQESALLRSELEQIRILNSDELADVPADDGKAEV